MLRGGKWCIFWAIYGWERATIIPFGFHTVVYPHGFCKSSLLIIAIIDLECLSVLAGLYTDPRHRLTTQSLKY